MKTTTIIASAHAKLKALTNYCFEGFTPPSGSVAYLFDSEFSKFFAAQSQCGSDFSENLQDSAEWFVEREARLSREEANESSFGWCSFGYRLLEGQTLLWYQTTSGTIYVAGYGDDGLFSGGVVYLPLARVTEEQHDRYVGRRLGNTQLVIEAALWGASKETIASWGDLYLGPIEMPEAYKSRLRFNEEVETRFGVCAMDSFEDAIVKNQIALVLKGLPSVADIQDRAVVTSDLHYYVRKLRKVASSLEYFLGA